MNNKFGITVREFEVIGLLSQGFNQREIAHKMGVKKQSIQTFAERARRKVGARTSVELIAKFERGELNE